ncbi:MAG: accessory Sec system protein Asp3 [Eubacterium sp.]|nr:accessory Sec system protein Asp3 [Eubacterium sp.]
MKIGEHWRIYWDEYASDTYLYGSEVNFLARDDVRFKNLLMPPGTVIKQWYSKTNFQKQKIEPALPMIDGEATYRLVVSMDVPEYEECMVRLVFYDKYENHAGTLTTKEKVTEFRCPFKTYSYRMQLINGGVNTLNFHWVEIQEIIKDE